MKKILRYLFTVIIITLMLSCPILASANLNLVRDDAYLLTDNDLWELKDIAIRISQEYKCNIAIVTVENTGDYETYDFAEYILDEYEMGYGEDKSVLLLVLSMDERDYALIAGGYGNIAFTDYGKDVLLEKYILPLLKEGKYYEAFSQYYKLTEEYLQASRSGEPFDKNTDPNYGKIPLIIKLAIVFLIPIAIAGATCRVWKKQMKTAISQEAAKEYILKDSFHLTRKVDKFLYRNESRRKIEKRSSKGTTISKSGSSGSSGKF